MKRRTAGGFLLASLLLLAATIAPAAQEPPPQRPAVLFLGSGQGHDPAGLRTWDDWLEAGWEVDVRDVSSVQTLEDLSPFNVVVVNFLPPVETDGSVSDAQVALEQALEPYLRQGGGVVVFCGGGEWGRMSGSVRHLLDPYGASVPEEQIVDPDHVLKVLDGQFRVNVTTQVEAAPMARGVSRVGYIGQASRADAIKLMMPVVLTAPGDWHVVLRGEKTAYSGEAENPGSSDKIKDTPASYSEFPLLAAWRNVGQGRLFVFPHNVAQTVASPEIFQYTFWDRDDQTKADTPQNRTFILQTVRWAAEPSLQTGVFGGYRTDRSLRPDDQHLLKPDGPIDWREAPTGEALAPPMGRLRGLIGAQSTFSGGEHTVAALCQAARAAGLDFLGFTERLERLNAETWERLQAECQRNSDDTFLALPGIRALDKEGNTWFALGWTGFPTPPSLTPDLIRIDNTYRFFASDFNYRLVGFGHVGRNPNPWYEMKHASACAVLTRDRGEVVDDSIQPFLQSSYNMENYLPMVLDEVATPEQVERAARGMVNVFTGGSVQALRDYCKGAGPHQADLFWETPHRWYLTSGPNLEYHGGLRLGTVAADEENENLFRYGFQISRMEKGDRVLLWDGPTLLREWRATGPAFATEHTWPHEQVRSLVVQVVRGEETVFLGSAITLHYGRRFNQCSDRQNTIPYNYQPDAEGNWYVSGIPIGCHYKAWTPETLVYGTYKASAWGAIGIEYGPPPYVCWYTSPDIPFESSRNEAAPHLASYQHHRLSCPGVLIVDEVTDRVYPNGESHLPDCAPPKRTEPMQLFNMTQRRYGLYGRIGKLNGQLVETTIQALQDVSLQAGAQFIPVSRHNLPASASLSVEAHVAGQTERYALAQSRPGTRQERLSPGDYVGVYPYGLAGGGAHYVVSGDLYAFLDSTPTQVGSSFLLKVPSRWPAGQKLTYALLYTTGGSRPDRPASDYEKVVSFSGFQGPFPALQNLQGGRLAATPVLATIETAADAVVRFSTAQDPEDPLGLTIRIHGSNPNWQAVYTLNGSKRWRYFGQLDGYRYLHLYTSDAEYSVVAGHPLLADRSDVRITLDDPLGEQGAFEVYNPTGEPVWVKLRTNPVFLPERSLEVQLEPYESRRVRVD